MIPIKDNYNITIAIYNVICFSFLYTVLECPSLEYLDSLVNNDHLNSLQRNEEQGKDLPAELVVHMSPVEVMDHPKYQDWIKR